MKRNIKQPCATSYCVMCQDHQYGQREDDYRFCPDRKDVLNKPEQKRVKSRPGSKKCVGKRWRD